MSHHWGSIRVGLFIPTLWTMTTQRRSISDEMDFCEDKNLAMIQGRSPGGHGSLRAQALVKYLKEHLAGNPAFVHKNMPGGGSLAANHIANVTNRPQDSDDAFKQQRRVS